MTTEQQNLQHRKFAANEIKQFWRVNSHGQWPKEVLNLWKDTETMPNWTLESVMQLPTRIIGGGPVDGELKKGVKRDVETYKLLRIWCLDGLSGGQSKIRKTAWSNVRSTIQERLKRRKKVANAICGYSGPRGKCLFKVVGGCSSFCSRHRCPNEAECKSSKVSSEKHCLHCTSKEKGVGSIAIPIIDLTREDDDGIELTDGLTLDEKTVSMKRPAKNPTTVSTPMVGAPTMEQLMAIGIDESMAHSMIQTAVKKLAVDLDSARVEFEKSSGLSAKMDELIKLQTEINDLKSTRPELYTKSGGRTRKIDSKILTLKETIRVKGGSVENQKKSNSYTSVEGCRKNFYCKRSNGVDGSETYVTEGCKKVYRNAAKRDEHSLICKHKRGEKFLN